MLAYDINELVRFFKEINTRRKLSTIKVARHLPAKRCVAFKDNECTEGFDKKDKDYE